MSDGNDPYRPLLNSAEKTIRFDDDLWVREARKLRDQPPRFGEILKTAQERIGHLSKMAIGRWVLAARVLEMPMGLLNPPTATMKGQSHMAKIDEHELS